MITYRIKKNCQQKEQLYFFCFQSFAKMFNSTPDDLDMHVIYDVSHNIAKVEEHFIDGKQKTLLVHRKGSTRAFPPHHPLIPVDYQVQNPCPLSIIRCIIHCLSSGKQSNMCCWLCG